MKRKFAASLVLLIIVLIHFSQVAESLDETKLNGEENKPIIVPDDYPTIQDAINHSKDGDTILIREGIYYENIEVNKSLKIMGEKGAKYTTIDGMGKGHVFFISANKCILSGLTIRNSGKKKGGIYLFKCSECKIDNVIIFDCWTGITVSSSDKDEVSLKDDSKDPGNNEISKCHISACKNGIFLKKSHRNFIHNCTIARVDCGIYIGWDSGRNTVYRCNVSWCSTGIYINSGFNYYNFFSDVVFILKEDECILSKLLEINDLLQDNIISSRNVIENCNISNNHKGIYLARCCNCRILHCTISNNSKYGICIGWESFYNKVTRCNIIGNECGLYLSNCSISRIIQNNFIDNQKHASFFYSRSHSLNLWMRNYWDNWGLPLMKIITGKFLVRKGVWNDPYSPTIVIPWLDFDPFPSLRPCKI